MVIKLEDFNKKLDEIFTFAEENKLLGVVIRTGEFHTIVGDFPSMNHRMSICQKAMKNRVETGYYIWK